MKTSKKAMYAIPYLAIIFVTTLIFKDRLISAISGMFCGLAYFGWILPILNNQTKQGGE